MEWPSKNVPRGGFMQPAVNTYNPETHKYLKMLIDESKMAMDQRKSNYILRNNDSITLKKKQDLPRYPVTIRPGSSKKRSMQTIVSSGVYEREQFRQIVPIVDREKEKEKLQNIMAYNKNLVVKKNEVIEKAVNKDEKEDINRFDQLVMEIKERQDWLKDMERLGEGKKYRQLIELQIQEKVREMERMKACDI